MSTDGSDDEDLPPLESVSSSEVRYARQFQGGAKATPFFVMCLFVKLCVFYTSLTAAWRECGRRLLGGGGRVRREKD